jgi:hypothetical protein
MVLKKIEIGRQTNFILALLLIHFVFFGYLANINYPPSYTYKGIGERILFLYQVLFSPNSFFSAIILGIIVFIMVLREPFFEYGIRNSIWLIPFIIVESWIWYWFIFESFDITLFYRYFIRYETYITILSLLSVNIFAASLAAIAKEKYKSYLERIKKV